MRRFVIQCYWAVSARAVAEVEDNEGLEEAIEKVQSNEYGLPDDADYMDGSFEVERSMCEEIDGEPGVPVERLPVECLDVEDDFAGLHEAEKLEKDFGPEPES